MDKRFLYGFLALSLIVNVVFIGYHFIGPSATQVEHLQDILDVDFNHSEQRLIKEGFKKNYGDNILSKRIGPALVNYTVLQGKGIFDMSIVGMTVGSDSVKISQWIQSIGGFICSPFFNLSNNNRKFFVKSFSSGQVFTGIVKDQTVILNIDFPNTDNLHRSSNREIRRNGEVVIYDSLKEVQVTRNDNIGL